MKKRLTMILASLFLFVGMAMAQSRITGTVVSADDGEPVIGASVKVVGTKTGTVTNVDGEFTLPNVNDGAKLEVSYIGMLTKTVKASQNIKIALKADNKILDEVVVTGYGSFKKSTFTGAASTLNTSKLEDVPAVSVEDKLAGGVPGVSVTSTSGAPGAVSSVRVRGMGSINAGNDPLYVIDGTPMQSGNISEFSGPSAGYNASGTNILATLNSNDIESITVIKDAAAASLYGSRAANGVIVITTKSGGKGKTHVNFRSDWGVSNMAIDYRPILSGEARRELLELGLKNYALYDSGKTEAEAEAYAKANIDQYAEKPKTGWTDWKDILFRTGHHSNYQVSLDGGSDNTKFYSSLSYMKQEGIVYNNGLERFTGNINVTHKFGRFTLRAQSLFSKMKQNLANEGTSYDGALANYAYFQNPSYTPYSVNEDGSYSIVKSCGMKNTNPLYERDHSSDVSDTRRTFNSIQLTYNIWDNLNLSEKITYDQNRTQEDVLWDKYSRNGGPAGVMQRILSNNDQFNTQMQLSYIKTFGAHNIDALLGFETEDFKHSYNYIFGEDYPGEMYEFANAGSTGGESKKSGYRLVSLLGRVNYNFNNRYYAGVSYRRDGSSRLAHDNRWGDFWSVSGSWRFSEENFFAPLKSVVSDGKLRLSYGVNGTQPSNYYDYMNLYKYGEYYNGQSGMGIVGIGNADLKWEKNYAFNVGLDLTFWNRLNVAFDWYTRKTKDLIFDMPISAVPGYYNSDYETKVAQNIGSLKNTGFELTITSQNFQTKDFTWTTSLNMAHNSNKVVKLSGEDQIISGILIHKVGQPYYSYYMYEYAGVDPKTGKELYYVNGDDPKTARNTTTEVSEANKTIIGKHQASLEGGITNNITYKFIDFGCTITYSIGGDAVDYATWQQSNGGVNLYKGAVPSYYNAAATWQKPGDIAALPKFQYGSSAVMSSRWLMPTDYLRVKNLTIGFSAPKSYIQSLGLSKARAYFSASNLLTWKSDDLRVDPEMPVNGRCIVQTPALRTFTFGIELGF